MPGLVSPGKDAEAALVTRRGWQKWSPDRGQAYPRNSSGALSGAPCVREGSLRAGHEVGWRSRVGARLGGYGQEQVGLAAASSSCLNHMPRLRPPQVT